MGGSWGKGVLLLQKGGSEKVSTMLKGGGPQKGNFNTGHLSFSHAEAGCKSFQAFKGGTKSLPLS